MSFVEIVKFALAGTLGFALALLAIVVLFVLFMSMQYIVYHGFISIKKLLFTK